MREDPPGTTPTITVAALGLTISVNTAFTPSFWKSGVASHVSAHIATTKTMPINPAFMATTPYTGIAKAMVPGTEGGSSGDGGSGSGGSGSGEGGGGGRGGRGGGGGFLLPAPAAPDVGGNGNGGLKGNPPAIFDSNCSQSDIFLREFRIFRLSNCNNASMNVPLDHIGIAASYICRKNVDDWVEYLMNKVDMALAQGVLPKQEDLWDMFVRDFCLAFTDTTKKQTTNKDLLNISMKPGELDQYIFMFKHLHTLAGWGANEPGTIMLFKKGLTNGLHHTVLEKTNPHPTTLCGWFEATRCQYKLWAEIKASLGGGFQKPAPAELQKWKTVLGKKHP